jgi:polysaccharide export outer membrane protein
MLEVERSIPTAREIAEGRRRRLAASEGSGAATDWDLRITRQTGLAPATIQASFETSLQPGDIIQITPKREPIESKQSGETQTSIRSLTGLASRQ